MQDNKLFTGSLCLTEIIQLAKQKHSAFQKAKNGKIYFSINVWMNDEADQFGNTMAIKIGKKKDSQDETPYLGNCKPVKREEPKPISEDDFKDFSGVEDFDFTTQ